jgi:site-specific recombinase XerD
MNNRLPQIHLVFDRYKKATLTKKASIEVRITYNYKQKYISTGIQLYQNQWKNGKIVSCPDALKISEILDRILSNIRSVLLAMVSSGNIDIFSIPDRLQEEELKKVSFLDFCYQRAEVRKYGKKEDTQERYDRFLRLFTEWGGITNYPDITESNIILYDNYLRSTGMKTYSRWNNYHRFLNSFIMDAIEAGYLRRNPYKWVNIERGRHTNGIGKYLTPEEFRILKHKDMPTKKLERVRDTFVFQTYTCFSYTDLRAFDAKLVQEVNGMKVYIGSRNKTSKPFTIPILSPAWDILNKYEGKLPIISNVKYNEYLKLVAQASGIDKPVSSHWARHTGATLLLNEGVSMNIVSKICGHSSIKITEQIYAKLLDETVVNAVSGLDI